jgi:hypothetical protein
MSWRTRQASCAMARSSRPFAVISRFPAAVYVGRNPSNRRPPVQRLGPLLPRRRRGQQQALGWAGFSSKQVLCLRVLMLSSSTLRFHLGAHLERYLEIIDHVTYATMWS